MEASQEYRPYYISTNIALNAIGQMVSVLGPDEQKQDLQAAITELRMIETTAKRSAAELEQILWGAAE
jgi:hypothetical protein